jgi:twitching motility protein PilT
MLPMEFIQRHRVLPLSSEGQVLTLGFVDDPSPSVVTALRQMLPGMDLRSLHIDAAQFDAVLRSVALIKDWAPKEPKTGGVQETPSIKSSPKLDPLLRRMVAEGASDVHLSGGQRPRWRIDGNMQEIADLPVLGGDEVLEIFRPLMEDRNRKQFDEENDTDFAYPIEGLARFRANLFRDKGGVGAVLRVIPAKILTVEQLGLPPITQTLCSYPKGLVLVTGPTGSGKSTTLAAMIDHINRNRGAHIITLEDPIEFVHQSQKCLVNQREVGPHTKSFHRALKAALREDPDIVLVGEMRDLETVSLALETANTGHLVFGTLHTSTAISTVDRIVDLFPVAQQGQVRAVLADTLRGVVAQTLCKRIGGGRAAALEILVVTFAVANLIREGKNHQIASVMSTGKTHGQQVLNEQLALLVTSGKVDFNEALAKALDKGDLTRRCGKTPAEEAGASPPNAAPPPARIPTGSLPQTPPDAPQKQKTRV